MPSKNKKRQRPVHIGWTQNSDGTYSMAEPPMQSRVQNQAANVTSWAQLYNPDSGKEIPATLHNDEIGLSQKPNGDTEKVCTNNAECKEKVCTDSAECKEKVCMDDDEFKTNSVEISKHTQRLIELLTG